MDIIKTAFALGAVRSGARTHGACFRLHGGFTVALLAATSCIVTTKQYFGDPIACDTSDAGGVRKDVAEAFCWMTGTYTVESMGECLRQVGVLFDDILLFRVVRKVFYRIRSLF